MLWDPYASGDGNSDRITWSDQTLSGSALLRARDGAEALLALLTPRLPLGSRSHLHCLLLLLTLARVLKRTPILPPMHCRGASNDGRACSVHEYYDLRALSRCRYRAAPSLHGYLFSNTPPPQTAATVPLLRAVDFVSTSTATNHRSRVQDAPALPTAHLLVLDATGNSSTDAAPLNETTVDQLVLPHDDPRAGHHAEGRVAAWHGKVRNALALLPPSELRAAAGCLHSLKDGALLPDAELEALVANQKTRVSVWRSIMVGRDAEL